MSTQKAKSVFETLSKIDVKDHIKKKGGLTYLPWARAWGILKSEYPLSTYTIYENADGLNYHHDGNTAWVKVGVTVEGDEIIEHLPIMNHSNKSIPLSNVTSFNVVTSIQRCATKAAARHGLGLYIYADEDLPIGEDSDDVTATPKKTTTKKKAAAPVSSKLTMPTAGANWEKIVTYLQNEQAKSDDVIVSALGKRYDMNPDATKKIKSTLESIRDAKKMVDKAKDKLKGQ